MHGAIGAAQSHWGCMESCMLPGTVSTAWSHGCCTEPWVLHGVVHATWNREYCMEPSEPEEGCIPSSISVYFSRVHAQQ
ncbi:hypothetical protein J6590_091515, partial [Homalodisca vitripennis]